MKEIFITHYLQTSEIRWCYQVIRRGLMQNCSGTNQLVAIFSKKTCVNWVFKQFTSMTAATLTVSSWKQISKQNYAIILTNVQFLIYKQGFSWCNNNRMKNVNQSLIATKNYRQTRNKTLNCYFWAVIDDRYA